VESLAEEATHWSAEAWTQVGIEFLKALELSREIRPA
jgi:hypothetical protein